MPQVIVGRYSSDRKALDFKSPQLKLNAGDALVLKGTMHALASVASTQGGKIVLLKPKEMDGMREHLRDERDSLSLAAQELFDRMLPLVRHKQREWRVKRKQESAATALQAVMRGKLTRVDMAAEINLRNWNRHVARVAARRAALELVRRQYAGPILSPTLLAQLARPSPSRHGAELDDVPETDATPEINLKGVIMAKRAKKAKAHATALNKVLAAAPEAAAIGAPLPLLIALTSPPVTVTARLNVNEVTIGSLQTPADVMVVGMTINKVSKALKANKRVDPATKLLKGDALSFCAPPHRLVMVTEVKGGQLHIAPRPRVAEAEAVANDRELLLSAANKLALWLQGAVRSRVAMRIRARRAHAAMVIQLAFVNFKAERQRAAAGALSKSFVRARRTRASPLTQDGLVPARALASTSKDGRGAHEWGRALKHARGIQAVGVMNSQLHRMKQKKKPSQVQHKTKTKTESSGVGKSTKQAGSNVAKKP